MGTRGGYSRIVIWQSQSLFACDVGGHQALQAATPSAEEETFRAADGTVRPRARVRTFELPVIKEDVIKHLRIMRALACPVRMVALGLSRHEFWYESSRLQLVPRRGGFGAFDGEVVRLESRVFEAAIWQCTNILEGIPWHVTESTDGLLGRDNLIGYEGPQWAGSASTKVSAVGVLTGSAVVTIELPIGGATVQLGGTGVTGQVTAISAAGAVLGSAAHGVAYKLPDSTWSLQVQVSAASEQPELIVTDPGKPLAVTFGSGYLCDLPASVTRGTEGTGAGTSTSTTAIDCPDRVLIYPSTDTDSYLTVTTPEALSESVDCDGLAVFTRTIQNDKGLPIEVSSIAFTTGGVAATPAAAFKYVICEAVCNESTGVNTREIEFQIVIGSIASGTYTVTITLASGESLTFDMTKA